jgi:RimJ/RimL family protein N-acetyltransferase
MRPEPGGLDLSGSIARRGNLELAWPEPHEYDLITELRNRDAVARWFLDRTRIDCEANREWLARGMRRGEEGLLSIRDCNTGGFLGTIGWTDFVRESRSACFGRLMLDMRAVLRTGSARSDRRSSVAAEAGAMLREYAFESMGLDFLTTWYIKGNLLAARVNSAIGMVIEQEGRRRSVDGADVATVELKMTREQWLGLVGGR